MSTLLPPAIVIGVHSPIGLTVVRELGRHGVPVIAVGRADDSLTRYSRYVARFFDRPPGGGFDWFEELIASTGAKACLAVSESDLIALATMPDEIGGCRILTPRRTPLDIVLSKSATLAHATSMGIDVPQSWQPQAGENFGAIAHGLSWPTVVKWANPSEVLALLENAGIEFRKTEYARDAGELCHILDRYRPIGQWPLVQSYAPGQGVGHMIFMDGGKAVLRFAHRRRHEWPPEGGVSSECSAEPVARHANQFARSEALLAHIGWDGAAMVEYRHDPATGRFCLMEINGRFWGSLPLASACGAEFGWATYARAILGKIPAPLLRDDLTARYMVPETRRLLHLLRGTPVPDPAFTASRSRTLLHYLLGFFNPKMRYYVFRLEDPGPFFGDAMSIACKALGTALARLPTARSIRSRLTRI